MLLRSDGGVSAFGCNANGQCEFPPLERGMWYTQVSAGFDHTALLRSDGTAFHCNRRLGRQGRAGQGRAGQRQRSGQGGARQSRAGFHPWRFNLVENCLPKNPGYEYLQISAGWSRTVLLRNDGLAILVDVDLQVQLMVFDCSWERRAP